jgi:hypothetical protein
MFLVKKDAKNPIKIRAMVEVISRVFTYVNNTTMVTNTRKYKNKRLVNNGAKNLSLG